MSLFAEASDAEALAAKRLPTCDVQASGAWQRGHRADVRSVQAPRGEQRPVLQLHQLVPRKQVQDDVLSADEEPNLPRRERLPSGHFDESDSGQVDDEFCHTHSAYFRGVCQRQERQRDASHTLTEFVEFLRREDAGGLPVIGAIAATTAGVLRRFFLGAGPLFPMTPISLDVTPSAVFAALVLGVAGAAVALVLNMIGLVMFTPHEVSSQMPWNSFAPPLIVTASIDALPGPM